MLAQKYKITCLATFLVFEASVRSDFLRHQSELIGWLEALNMLCSGLESWFVQKEQVQGSRNEKMQKTCFSKMAMLPFFQKMAISLYNALNAWL